MVATPSLANPGEEFRPFSWITTLIVVLIGVGLGFIGTQLSPYQNTSSPIWPLSGFAIAVLHVYGSRAFLSVFLIHIATQLLTPIPWWGVGIMAMGGFCGSWIGYTILKALKRIHTKAAYFTETALVLTTALIAPLPPTIAQFITEFFGPSQSELTLINSCLMLLVGHTAGILVITMPAILWMESTKNLTWWRMNQRPLAQAKELGWFTICAITMALLCYFVFMVPEGHYFLFAMLPLFLLAVKMLKPKWFYLWVLLFNAMAMVFTLKNHGPFAGNVTGQNLMNLQLFLSTIAITAMSLVGFRRAGSLRNPAYALCIGWAFCGALFYLLLKNQTQQDALRVDNLISDMTREIQDHMDDYINLIRSAVGFVTASQDIQPEEWQQFATKLGVTEIPGLGGLGLAYRVIPEDTEKFARDMRALGNLHFKIKAVPGEVLTPNHVRYIVAFFEPDNEADSRIGIDLGSESERRRIAEEATLSGHAAMTHELLLFVARKYGFLILMPAYHAGKPVNTNQQRYEALKGLVVAPFYTHDFFHSIVDSKPRELALDVFDSPTNLTHPVFSSGDPPKNNKDPYLRVTSIELVQKRFFLAWRPTKHFVSAESMGAVVASCAGTLLSLFLAGLIVNLQVIREKAERIAAEKTFQLEKREQQFAQQANTLAAIMDAVPVGIFRGNVKGQLIMVNEDWQNITGIREEDALGKSWTQSIDNSEKQEAKSIFDRLSATKDVIRHEFKLHSVAGEQRIVSISIVPERNTNGEMIGFLGALNDLTELKKTEAAIEFQRAAIAHSSKMASLGEMAGGIAHEINNPLAIIHGKSRQMQKMIAGGELTPAQTIHTLELIEKTSLRISKIIKGLRTISRSGEKDPLMQEDVNTIVEQTLDLCRERFKNTGIELIVKSQPGIIIECRSTQIGQVLLNLLNNAFDAVYELPERWVDIETSVSGDKVRIAVTDSGHGISPEIREKIFHPFYTTKDINEGTGLGLSISRSILEEHHGRLYVDEYCPHTRFVCELDLIMDRRI